MIVTLKDIEKVQKQLDRLKTRCVDKDKFKDLKKAHSEGAILECYNSDEYGWNSIYGNDPDWSALKYRIKDNISIASWDAHKDLIKQWWDGAEIQVKDFDGWWNVSMNSPLWEKNKNYRVKDKWKLPEYEDGSKWIIDGVNNTIDSYYNRSINYTKAGRRRATKELAEICAKNSKTRDLLEAYAHHLDPKWRDEGVGTEAHYIYIYEGIYETSYIVDTRQMGSVYMSKDTAEQICKALNNKEISFD